MGMGRNWNWLYGNVREPECKNPIPGHFYHAAYFVRKAQEKAALVNKRLRSTLTFYAT